VKRARQIVRIMDTLPVFDDIFLKLQHPLYGPDNADGSHGWTEEFSATSIREYKRFMAIATVFGEASPAKVVDEIWHSHITDTRRYPGDCQKCFGEFMHHYPYFGLGVNERNGVNHGERDELWDRYKVTLRYWPVGLGPEYWQLLSTRDSGPKRSGTGKMPRWRRMLRERWARSTWGEPHTPQREFRPALEPRWSSGRGMRSRCRPELLGSGPR
jgi:hypothetical protein